MTISSRQAETAFRKRAVLCLVTLMTMPMTAHAYIDPGTGSLVFQSLLAVLFGIGVALRQIRRWLARIWAFVLRRPYQDEDAK